MVWYEHLFGILAVVSIAVSILVYACIYVGAQADRNNTRHRQGISQRPLVGKG